MTKNWHFRNETNSPETKNVEELVSTADERTSCIARFVASISLEIPYSLLAFYPHFYIQDLPLTPGS